MEWSSQIIELVFFAHSTESASEAGNLLCLHRVQKVFYFLAIRKRSKVQQDTAFSLLKSALGELTVC